MGGNNGAARTRAGMVSSTAWQRRPSKIAIARGARLQQRRHHAIKSDAS
jgi:hypothetical protein